MDFNVDVNIKTNGKEKVDDLEQQLEKLNNSSIKIKFDADGNGIGFIKDFNKQMETLNASALKSGQNVSKNFNQGFKSSKFNGYDEFFKQIEKDKKKADKLVKEFQDKSYAPSHSDALKGIRAERTAETKATNEYLKEIEKQSNKLADIKKKISQNTFDVDVSGVKKSLSKYSGVDPDKLKNAEESYKKLLSLQKELKSGMNSDVKTLSDQDLVSKYDDYLDVLQKVKNEIKIISNESGGITKPFSTLDAITASNKTLTWLKNNSKAAKELGSAFAALALKQKNATNSEDLSKYNKEFRNLVSEAQVKGLTGNSLMSEIERGFKQIGQFVGVYGILQKGVDTAKQMAQAVYDIDTAMTNLYKVTDETSSKYNEFLKKSGSNAKSLGRDVSSYIDQTATWAKLGYTLDQSSELSKISSIYANVGEVDDKTAVSDIVTVMKAYNMDDSQALNIVDMLNELGNNYATDAASLGDGLKNMASTMAMSNTSLEKSLAILTGGTEITQDAGELGNAIKVAVLRMHGQKGALEDIGEYADDIESVSKMQTQVLNLTKGAVNIMDSADPNSFRDYYDVMSDIAEILPKLNDTEQADLIETLFGKNRANQGQAILQAFQSGQIQKAYNTALNSEGSAMQEQERWLESMEAKIQQFKASFQTLSNSTLNSDLFKGVIDSGTSFLNLLTNIIDNVGILPTALGAIGGIQFFKNLDLFC